MRSVCFSWFPFILYPQEQKTCVCNKNTVLSHTAEFQVWTEVFQTAATGVSALTVDTV